MISSIASCICWHTPWPEGTGILLESPPRITGSLSPLKLNPLRYLVQRWFSPQSFVALHPHVPVCPTVHFQPNCSVLWYLMSEVFTHKNVSLWNCLTRFSRCASLSTTRFLTWLNTLPHIYSTKLTYYWSLQKVCYEAYVFNIKPYKTGWGFYPIFR